MRNIFLSLLSLLSLNAIYATYDPNDWIECDKIYINALSPVQNQAVFVNSYTGAGEDAGNWETIDLSDQLPSTAKAVMLAGRLLITHGTSSETADLQISFRAKGETTDYYHIGQTIEASIGDGQRSGMAVWVPLDENQCFEYKWTRTNTGQWPTWSAYGINLNISAWAE